MASDLATDVAPQIASEIAPQLAPEVSEVEIVAAPPFDFGRHLRRRAIAQDLELERLAGFRVAHGAGKIGGRLHMLASGAGDDVPGPDARLRRGTAALDSGNENAGVAGSPVMSPELRCHLEESNAEATPPGPSRESPDKGLVPVGRIAVFFGHDDGPFLLFGRLVAGGKHGRRRGGEQQDKRQSLQIFGVHGGILSKTETPPPRKGFAPRDRAGQARNRLPERGSVRFLMCLALTLGPAGPAPVPSASGFLYKASLVQAAPGKLLEVVELYKSLRAGPGESPDEPPLWMRHSQGDRWDLLLLFPIGSYADYYAQDRVAKREKALRPVEAVLAKLRDSIAWQEDVFVLGPPLAELRGRVAGSAFFHVEMFQALPGRRADLFREREMENAYLKALGRPQNLIFVRDQGASWDLFTIGFYRDLKHYAESADIPEAAQEAAARAAGFESASRIGPTLRTLISSHHDTLAVAIK